MKSVPEKIINPELPVISKFQNVPQPSWWNSSVCFLIMSHPRLHTWIRLAESPRNSDTHTSGLKLPEHHVYQRSHSLSDFAYIRIKWKIISHGSRLTFFAARLTSAIVEPFLTLPEVWIAKLNQITNPMNWLRIQHAQISLYSLHTRNTVTI